MVTTVGRFVHVTLTTQKYVTLTMERASVDLVGKAIIAHSMLTNALMKTFTHVLQIHPVRIQKERIDANVTSGSRNLDLYA